MSEQLPAPLQVVCRVAGVSRSAACEARRRRGASEPLRRRPGPVGAMSDLDLLVQIHGVLADSPFVGEGHRKVWARLRRERGILTSRKRVLRLTREAGLLAPTAQVRKRAARLHDGTITVTVPDTLWATDATEGWSQEGRSAIFAIIDHASGEVWTDASLRMDRWAAADLLREVTTERFGSIERAVAAGLALRYDGGPCFCSEHYQAEIDHLGIARSPAYHYEPETNGCIERFMGTLKEQILWIERFDTHEQLRARVREFARTYNQSWLLERHAYRTPIETREYLVRQAALA
ncbi:MAG: transposase [Solirubrobacteraceae bacterium]